MVVFNDLIKVMHEVIWTATLPEASTWDNWARNLPFNARWFPLLLPPAVGGLAVGLLRKATGGFEEQAQNQQQTSKQAEEEDESGSKQKVASARTAIPQQKFNPLDSAQLQSRSASDNDPDSNDIASPPDKLSSSSSASSSNADRVNSGDTASTSGQDSSSVWSLSWLADNSQECRASAMHLARPFFKVGAALAMPPDTCCCLHGMSDLIVSYTRHSDCWLPQHSLWDGVRDDLSN